MKRAPERDRIQSARRCGNAYIEALIVTCLFSLMFAWALTFGRRYVAQMRLEQEARALWWRIGQDCPTRLQDAADALALATDRAHARALLEAGLAEAALGASGSKFARRIHDTRDDATPACADEPNAQRADAQRARHWFQGLLDQVTR